MISDKDFLKLLLEEPNDASAEEYLKKILDDELEKSEEEIDPDLIDYCLDKLDRFKEEKAQHAQEKADKTKKHKNGKGKAKRYVLIAAAAAVLIAGTVMGSADFHRENSPDGVVEYSGNDVLFHFDRINEIDELETVDLEEKPGTKLVADLTENGFVSLVLPEALLSEEYTITNSHYEKFKYLNSANYIINCKYGVMQFVIEEYAYESMLSGNDTFLNVDGAVESMQIGDLTVFYFSQYEKYNIVYLDGLVQYSFNVPFDYNETIDFIKTIKKISP